VREKLPAPAQTGPGAHPASYTMGTEYFSGVERPGRGVDLPSLSNSDVKEGVDLKLYYPWAFMVGYRLNFTVFLFLK